MKDRKRFSYLKIAAVFLILLSLSGSYLTVLAPLIVNAAEITAAPATSVSVRVDYAAGTITVTAGSGGSNKLYFSTDKKKTWELIETAGNIIDIRSLMKSSAVTLYFKGNRDQAPLEFVIPAEDKDLKMKYSVTSGRGSISYENLSAGRVLEYRIGTDGSWGDYPAAGIVTQMYEVTGATLQFRMKAVQTARAGKIVSLKIPKRAKAPTIKVNGSKLTFTGLKSGTIQYRVNNNTEWIAFSPSDAKAKEVNIASLAASGLAQNARIPAVTVEFRSIATDKSPASSIRTIELAIQREVPTAATVSLVGTTLTINDASPKNAYEILVKHTGEVPDLSTDKWTSISSPKSQIIKKAGKAYIVPGDIIYVRYKAGKDSETGLETMASRYMSIQVATLTIGQ